MTAADGVSGSACSMSFSIFSAAEGFSAADHEIRNKEADVFLRQPLLVFFV